MLKRKSARWSVVVLAAMLGIGAQAGWGAGIEHVFHISVDGLRPDAVTTLTDAQLPNFHRLRSEGAFTDNARCDYLTSETLPSHVTQLTGRAQRNKYGSIGVGAVYTGHDWLSNSTPPLTTTLESNKGSYVAGAFDVAHAAGLTTGLYASKTKFSLFPQSWPTLIDHSLIANYQSAALVNQMKADFATTVQGYTFLHFYEPDYAGHTYGWMSEGYLDSVQVVDAYLGEILALIAATPALAGKTAIVLTTDHAGTGFNHADPAIDTTYTIPFYVWGPGVPSGADLYAMNPLTRLDPGTGRPSYLDPLQPIRNGEAANVALDLLGLDAIPGSWLNGEQDLLVRVPEPATLSLLGLGGLALLRRKRRR